MTRKLKVIMTLICSRMCLDDGERQRQRQQERDRQRERETEGRQLQLVQCAIMLATCSQQHSQEFIGHAVIQ